MRSVAPFGRPAPAWNQLLMATVPGVPFPFWVCGTEWIIDGEAAWGQDQDVPISRPAPSVLRRREAACPG
jgi:hypothetical protein